MNVHVLYVNVMKIRTCILHKEIRGMSYSKVHFFVTRKQLRARNVYDRVTSGNHLSANGYKKFCNSNKLLNISLDWVRNKLQHFLF